jgi:hypothetical protein
VVVVGGRLIHPLFTILKNSHSHHSTSTGLTLLLLHKGKPKKEKEKLLLCVLVHMMKRLYISVGGEKKRGGCIFDNNFYYFTADNAISCLFSSVNKQTKKGEFFPTHKKEKRGVSLAPVLGDLVQLFD